tara:strand:+ start:179 stop:856 length:678 start_codon:yes stop_codon:yes gene_type:complete
MAFSFSPETNPNRVRENTASKRKAERRVQKVDERREKRGGPRIKKLFGKSTEGQMIDGEYRLGLADRKLFGGAGKKAIKKSGRIMEGDHAKHIAANRKAKAKKEKRGWRDPLLAKRGAYLKKYSDSSKPPVKPFKPKPNQHEKTVEQMKAEGMSAKEMRQIRKMTDKQFDEKAKKFDYTPQTKQKRFVVDLKPQTVIDKEKSKKTKPKPNTERRTIINKKSKTKK